MFNSKFLGSHEGKSISFGRQVLIAAGIQRSARAHAGTKLLQVKVQSFSTMVHSSSLIDRSIVLLEIISES